MAIDHSRVEARIEVIDNLLHNARVALKAKVYGETYLRGAREAEALVDEAWDQLSDLISDLEMEQEFK